MFNDFWKGILSSCLGSSLIVLFAAVDANAQCTGESATIINQCSGQQPQISVSPAGGNTNYKWFVGGSQFGTGGDFTYQNPLSGTQTIHYQKEVTATGGPAAGSGTYTMPAAGTVVNSNYSVSVNSTTSFKLNTLTVPIKLYYCDPAKTYRLKVIVGPVASPTSASIWYDFNCSALINTSEGQTYLVKMDVNTSTTNLGLVIPSGATTISVIYNDGSANPGNVSDLSGLVAFPTTAFNNTYTVGTTTITHASSGNRPAFLDWDLTTICAQQAVLVNAANGTNCCVPGNVNVPNIVSSTGSTVIDTDPVSPAITLSTPLQSGFYYQWYKNNTPVGSLTLNANSLSVTTGGSYTVRVVEKSGDIAKSACFKEDLLAISKRVLFAEADKTTICLGESVALNAKGATGNTATSIVWSPSTGISNINSKTPTFTPNATGVFNLTVDAEVPVGNQVINGDFESSTAADAKFNFSPYYHYVDPSTSTPSTTPATDFGIPGRRGVTWLQNGNFSIYNYVFSNGDGYTGIKPCRDHTTGAGNLLFTDAAAKNIKSVSPLPPLTDTYIWSQQVTLQAGQTYEFSSWFTNVNSDYCACTDPFDGTVNAAKSPSGQPQVNFYVNNVLVNPTPITIGGATCQWQKVSYNYIAPTSGTTTIKIVEVSREDSGNDFAIDDIAFGAPGRQTDTINIKVQDCNILTTNALACSGDSVPIVATTNGVFTGWKRKSDNSTTGIGKPLNTTTNVESNGTVIYVATAKFHLGNLVTNGDFESGATGFTSSFSKDTYLNTGKYMVTQTITGVSNGFVNPTGIDANFLAVNTGGGTTGEAIWSQSVTVTQAGEHMLSFDIANIVDPTNNNKSLPSIQVKIGATTHPVTISAGSAFTKVSFIYNASTGPLTLQIIDLYAGTQTNGIALDDIVFSPTITKTSEITPPQCLPVTYTYFNLENTAQGVKINWGTAQEWDSKYFVVERSINGHDFEAILTLTSGGNSSKSRNYSIVDDKTIEGTAYYRIKEISNNGLVDYTKILSINRLELSEISIYPNPSYTSFTIFIKGTEDETVSTRILNIDGSCIEEASLALNQNNTIGTHLKAGVYILEIQTVEGLIHQKIVKE